MKRMDLPPSIVARNEELKQARLDRTDELKLQIAKQKLEIERMKVENEKLRTANMGMSRGRPCPAPRAAKAPAAKGKRK